MEDGNLSDFLDEREAEKLKEKEVMAELDSLGRSPESRPNERNRRHGLVRCGRGSRTATRER